VIVEPTEIMKDGTFVESIKETKAENRAYQKHRKDTVMKFTIRERKTCSLSLLLVATLRNMAPDNAESPKSVASIVRTVSLMP
jgi:hypothetical protein